MRDAFIARLLQRAEKDPRIVLVTGDLGFGVFNEYREKLPDQFINAGVAEQNMTTLAAGMALEGYVVFTYSIANFSTLRCLEQIRNDACYHGANVKVVSIGGGFSYGSLGISHHATEDIAILRSLPDIVVSSPCTLWEAEEATDALIDAPGTTYLRLDKSAGEDPVKEAVPFELGKGRVLNEGDDVCVIVTGGILEEAWKVQQELKSKGVSVRLISMHSIKPIDVEIILKACNEVGKIVTLEEHTLDGGLGSAVAEVIMDNGASSIAFKRVGLQSCFSSIVGSQEYLRSSYGMDAKSVLAEISKIL